MVAQRRLDLGFSLRQMARQGLPGKTISNQKAFASTGLIGMVLQTDMQSLGELAHIISCRAKYEETWVALNWKITLPTKNTHPSFPLWKLGYSPDQVYDAFFPAEFRFLCNPSRPAVCGRFGLAEDRLWRFEFVIAPGEDGTEMAMPHKIQEVVFPYFRHPGRRYE